MQTMQAVVLPSPSEHVITPAQIAVPRISADELLVHIKAVGVGIHDTFFFPRQLSYPYPIGVEAAGVVAEVGSAAARYQVGDRIAVVSMMQSKGGVWAEYAAIRQDALIVPIPDRMSFEEAAAIPVAGNATLRGLHALGAIPEGEAIFVAGASGAIGTFAIQLARKRGWQVAASASSQNHDYLAALGASLTVDYRDPDWPAQVRRWRPGGVAGALAVQPQTSAESMSVVQDGGTVVTVSGDQVLPQRGITVTGLAYGVDVYRELLALVDDIVTGDVTLVIERVFPFADAVGALQKVQTRHARGKVVLSLT